MSHPRLYVAALRAEVLNGQVRGLENTMPVQRECVPSATKETFEEHHNASLMWQTFLRRLRPGVFASQNQKDLVSLDSSNLFVFLDAYFCAKKGSLVALASLVFIILLWGQAPAFRL